MINNWPEDKFVMLVLTCIGCWAERRTNRPVCIYLAKTVPRGIMLRWMNFVIFLFLLS